MGLSAGPSCSVVVPVRDGEATLERCLSAIVAAGGDALELIVVDDGSRDGSAAIASRFTDRVLRCEGNGPAAARNRGVAAATRPIVVFVDADCEVHDDAIAALTRFLEAHPGHVAAFGSYDDAPEGRGVVSRFKNLAHHHVHQRSSEEAATFWAGCGAVRRDAFLAAGGFDERYARPQIEDIELGYRLTRAGGHIAIVKGAQAKHLKQWTLRSMVSSDVLDRALPWSRLLLARGAHDDLNLSHADRIAAVAAWGSVASLAASFVVPAALAVLALLLLLLAVLNRDMYRLFAKEGAGFLAAAFALHVLQYLYGSAAFGFVAVQAVVGPDPEDAAAKRRLAALRAAAAGVALALFALGLLAAFGVAEAEDAARYARWADELSAGSLLAHPRRAFFLVFLLLVKLMRALFGDSWQLAIAIVNAVSYGIAGALLALAALRSVSRRATFVIACALWAIAPETNNWSRLAIADSTLLLFSCLLVERMSARATLSAQLAVVALASLTRPTGVLLLVPVLALRWFDDRDRVVSSPAKTLAIALGAAFAAALAWVSALPFMIASREALPMPLRAGVAIFERGEVVQGRRHTYHPTPETWGDGVAIWLDKLVHFWQPTSSTFWVAHRVADVLFYVPALLGGAAALALLVTKRLDAPASRMTAMALVGIATFTLFHSLHQIDFDWRYRLPALPFLILAASVALARSIPPRESNR